MNNILNKLRRFFTRAKSHVTKKRLIIAGLIVLAVLIITPIATYAYYARTISDRELLMNRNNTGIILKDKNGTAFYSSGVRSTQDNLTLDQIADDLENAVIASEDKDFYSHNGFSATGTGRALVNNVTSGDATDAGGSTITQQLVKNKLVGSQKSYIRKYQELAMAIAVERRYEKDDILEMYLNSAYFGEGAFGIADAAKTYFNKSAANLTLAESTMLAGLLPAPSYYSPISGEPGEAKAAQKNVLRKMIANNMLTAQQRDEVLATELEYYMGSDGEGRESGRHFADMVVDKLIQEYGEERVRRSGFEVTTTLDLSKQRFAEQTIAERIEQTKDQGGRNAGLVSINPKNGHVIALVGSVDYYNEDFGQVNMTTALRQPGSSFKPIYYSDAIERRAVTAGTIIEDKRTTYGGTYTPRNFDNRYKGNMSVRSALAESRNIPAVEVLRKDGVRNAVQTAQRFGLDSVDQPDKYGLTLALGTAEVRLFAMTNAYSAFANQGKQFEPVLYTAVQDKYGAKVYEQTKQPAAKQVIGDDTAYVISSILADQSARAPTYGSRLNISGQNVAFKTGTTNDSRDAWIIGYTPSVVTGVWMGNNENEPMTGLAGGSGAGSIWKPVMTEYLSGTARESFYRPSSVSSAQVCVGTNKRALNDYGEATRTEYYLSGTGPSGTCNTQEKPKEDEKDKKEKQDKEKKKDETEESVEPENPETEEPPVEEDPENPGEGEEDPIDEGGGDDPTTPVSP